MTGVAYLFACLFACSPACRETSYPSVILPTPAVVILHSKRNTLRSRQRPRLGYRETNPIKSWALSPRAALRSRESNLSRHLSTSHPPSTLRSSVHLISHWYHHSLLSTEDSWCFPINPPKSRDTDQIVFSSFQFTYFLSPRR